MISRTVNFPKQRYTIRHKMKNGGQWSKDCLDAIAQEYVVGDYGNYDRKNYSQSDQAGTPYHRYVRMRRNYDLYLNKVDSSYIEDMFNPMGIEVGQLKQDITAYNKAPNKINLLVGDELKRPFNFRAFIEGGDGINTSLNFMNEKLRAFLDTKVDLMGLYAQQQILSKLEQSPETEEQQAQVQAKIDELSATLMPPKMVDQYMKTNYVDSREISVNKLLTVIMRKEQVPNKKANGFKHATISGEEIVYAGDKDGEFHIEIVNPLSFFYSKTPNTQFFEDGMYAGTRVLMTVSDVLSKYGDYLDDADIEKLEGKLKGPYGTIDRLSSEMKYGHDYDPLLQAYSDNLQGLYREGNHGTESSRSDLVTVTHAEWVSEKKAGFLTFINEYGDEEMMLVDENFEVPEYAEMVIRIEDRGKRVKVYQFDEMELEWHWIPEVWEGVRIEDTIYCKMGPKKYQYRSKLDPYKVKLGYHGCAYNNINGSNMGPMDYMKPFLIFYIIVANKLVRLVARDKGFIFPIDTSMIDPKIGLEKTLYYIMEQDLYPFNSLQNAETPGASQRSGSIQGGVNMSNMQHIAAYVQLLESLDHQISDVAGIPKSREGQTSPNQAVTNSQQDIVQSSSITEMMYHLHDLIWSRVFESTISYHAQYIKDTGGQKYQYLLDDMSLETFRIGPDDLENCDFGVFINNSGRQQDIFNRLRALGEVMLNSEGSKMSDLITLYKSNSIEEVHEQIKSSEREAQKQVEAQRQHEQELQEQMKAAEMEKIEIEHQNKLEQIRLEGQIDKELREIDSFKFQRDQDIDNNGIPDQLEIDKIRSQERQNKLNAAVKLKDIESKERIAKQKKASESKSK